MKVTMSASEPIRSAERSPGGVAAFISWHRLATEALRESGNLRPEERVVHFYVTAQGIHYFVETGRT